jgi:3-phosphoshikimate 1-carboxyvinyltransferase
MNQTVRAGRFGGEIPAIASKSCAHRLLICAALSDAPCRIDCATVSDDILATAACLRALGAQIEPVAGGFAVTPLDRANLPAHAQIDVGESGSTLRFLLPVVAALGVDCAVQMHGRLPERPLSPLYEELTAHGVQLGAPGSNPLSVSGQLIGQAFTLPANVSSQFLSGLLLALPLLGGGTLTMTGTVESGAYLDLTVDAMRRCGIAVTRDGMQFTVAGQYHAAPQMVVEGDWSNAAFWLCAGAVGSRPVTVTNLNLQSAQGDRAIVELLTRFGASVEAAGDRVTVSPAPLTGCEIDAAGIPDLVPVLSAVACAAQGETRIYGASRLRLKESDRLAATHAILGAMGADVQETADGLIFHGGAPLHGATVDAWNDHRIAMTAAIAALRCDGPVTITNAQAVRKSYPAFFQDYAALGGETEQTP